MPEKRAKPASRKARSVSAGPGPDHVVDQIEKDFSNYEDRMARAKLLRAEADAEAARLRADALAGRLIPRYLCDDLINELRARLDACARHLDAAYGPGPSAALADALDGMDAWWTRRLEQEGVRVAMEDQK